jgi:DNA polymerase
MTSLASAIKSCRACPLGRRRDEDGVPGEHVTAFGDEDSEPSIVFIGEAPGGSEMKIGRPFIGESGNLLRALIHDCRVTNYYLTNIVKHRPPYYPKQQAPDAVAVAACGPFLKAELSSMETRKIVLLGKTAATAMLADVPGNIAVGKLVNRIHTDSAWPEYEFLVLFHPAMFLYNRTASFTNVQINNWKRALMTFAGDKPPTYPIEHVSCLSHP